MSIAYTAPVPLAITAGNLAAAANRSSAAVTTSIDKNVAQILLEVVIDTTAVAPSGNKQVVVYGYKSLDGTTFGGNSSVTDNVDGTDKALTTIGSPSTLVLLGTVQLNQGAAAVTARGEFEVSGPFGCIPPAWGIVLYNDAGTALGASVAARYREVHYT
jgi:hypothetical protein